MKKFQISEKVTCYLEIYKGSSLYTPTPDSGNAVEIEIFDMDGTEVLEATAMGEEATGKFSYLWDSSLASAGKYRGRFTAVDGSTPLIKDAVFRLEA